jgi:hypothetical protein
MDSPVANVALLAPQNANVVHQWPVSVGSSAPSWNSLNPVPNLKHLGVPRPCPIPSNPIYRTVKPKIDINGQGRT